MASPASTQWSNFEFPHLASAWSPYVDERPEQPDLFDSEMGNLETLLSLDDNFMWPEGTPESGHEDISEGRRLNSRRALTIDDGSLTPQSRTTENSQCEESGQGQRGDSSTACLTGHDSSTPPSMTPETHNEEKGKRSGGHNSTAPRDTLLHHRSGTGIEFKDLWYTVVKRQKKDGVWFKREAHLLQGITGVASKGEVTAVLGSSGAGKSTLLDALAGRIASGSLGGTTTVDGRLVTPTLMKRMSAYVMQDDQLFPLLTVWETLWFAAEVRLHRSISRDEKRQRVTNLLQQLGLTKAQNTYVGDEKTRGISGGEKRRLSIGVDIIHGPTLLFMDEPTSGLDSGNALNVIEKVHGIAKAGSTVILTIHQPSSRILRFVNRLIVLARGQLIYQGSPSYLSTHLVGFGLQVPRAENPVEYLLDVVQEYDNSVHGIEPLVQYNKDGAKFNADDTEFVITPVRGKTPPVRAHSQKIRSTTPDRNRGSENTSILSKIASPFSHQSKTKTPDRTFDAMEAGYGSHEDKDDDYDHSINGVPKLAIHYYKGFLEDLADRFLTPTSTPLPRRTTVPPIQRKTTFTTPWSKRTRLSPKELLQRASSTVPIRSSERTQVQKTQEQSCNKMDTRTISDKDDNPPISKQGSTESTVSEKDYEVPRKIQEEKFANIWRREVVILMLRNLKLFQRAPEHFLSRQITVTVMGVLLATLFTNVRTHRSDLGGVKSTMSFFIFTVTVFFFSSNDAVPAFIMERLIFIRETSHNAYRASSFVIANAVVSIPFLAVQAMTFTLITWWALGFQHTGQNAASFCFFFLILFVSLLCAISFVMFVSSVVPNYILGYAAVVAFTAFYFLMCGFFIQRKKMPGYWIWAHYISTLKYPYEAMLLNEYGNPNNQVCYFSKTDTGECPLNGKDLLRALGITQLTKWESLAILGAMAVFYRFLFYCVLRFGTKNQRS